jgi:hypothetical protein
MSLHSTAFATHPLTVECPMPSSSSIQANSHSPTSECHYWQRQVAVFNTSTHIRTNTRHPIMALNPQASRSIARHREVDVTCLRSCTVEKPNIPVKWEDIPVPISNTLAQHFRGWNMRTETTPPFVIILWGGGRGQLKFSDDDIFPAVTCRVAESATVYPTQRSNTFQALAGTPCHGKAATWREQFLDYLTTRQQHSPCNVWSANKIPQRMWKAAVVT